MLQRSLLRSLEAGLQCMCWMPSLWFGFWLLGLGLEDGPASPTSSSKLTLLASLPSATSATPPARPRPPLQRHRLGPVIAETATAIYIWLSPLNILYHTMGVLSSLHLMCARFCNFLGFFFLGFIIIHIVDQISLSN